MRSAKVKASIWFIAAAAVCRIASAQDVPQVEGTQFSEIQTILGTPDAVSAALESPESVTYTTPNGALVLYNSGTTVTLYKPPRRLPAVTIPTTANRRDVIRLAQGAVKDGDRWRAISTLSE